MIGIVIGIMNIGTIMPTRAVRRHRERRCFRCPMGTFGDWSRRGSFARHDERHPQKPFFAFVSKPVAAGVL
jgi:hypothetical protein